MENSVNILYEDADILVCVKPAGTASQTKMRGQQDMVSLLCNYRYENKEEPYIGLVHRLDQPVEGILVFGKHAKSTAALNRQLQQETFSKIYLAVTEGTMPAPRGRLQDYLKKDGRSNLSVVVKKEDPKAKKAELLYELLMTDESFDPVQNLVKIQLLTGRHHQIRVQMAHSGTPLAGDVKYGRSQKHGAGRGTWSDLGLCACGLEFAHPGSHKKMRFSIVPSQPVFQKFGSIIMNYPDILFV